MSYRRYRRYNLTPAAILIGVNVLMFLATTADEDLIYSLGLQPASLSERPWTIVTNLFIHGGLGHIIANMLTLYFFGTYLSGVVGQRNFLIIYFLGGLMGNLLFIALAPSSSTGIGASGAVFALGGTLTVMRPNIKVIVFPIPAPLPLWVAVIGGFLVISFLPSVAWQAHLGGLALGLASGYFFTKRRRRFPYF
jgi:membrane associated rhomboid family serine protease